MTLPMLVLHNTHATTTLEYGQQRAMMLARFVVNATQCRSGGERYGPTVSSTFDSWTDTGGQEQTYRANRCSSSGCQRARNVLH